MRYIIVDLEATCWKWKTTPDQMEIIEIGAVALDSSLQNDGEFSQFVRPIWWPKISEFCTELTSIQQSDLNGADDFSMVFPRFLGWIGKQSYTICSWGDYDMKQLKVDCKRHNIKFPKRFRNHINLKQEFATFKGIKPCGMAATLQILGLPLQGKHHRGIDDARNIARIAQCILL